MEEIQKNIVEWIQYDSKIKEESKKIKNYKEKRDLISESLLPMLVSNNLEEHTFNIPQYKKSFGCVQSSSSEGLTYKFLENAFKEFFDKDSGSNTESNAEEKSKELLEYIKTHRKKTTKRVLKCSDLE